LLSKDGVRKGLTQSLELLDDIAIDNPYAPKFAASLTAVLLNADLLDLPTLIESLAPAESMLWLLSFSIVVDVFVCVCVGCGVRTTTLAVKQWLSLTGTLVMIIIYYFI
jgi:hypothetical protein